MIRGMRTPHRRALPAAVAAVAAVALALGAGSAVATGKRIFYLTVKPHQCLVASTGVGNGSNKWVLAVPCSDPAHDLEVYAVGHGGWGHAAPPSSRTAVAVVQRTCLNLYARVTGHALATFGWDGFRPDPGAETRRYGDRIVCMLRTWPKLRPLGAGWHVH